MQLLSRFSGFQIVGSHRAKKQSCSTRQGLRVGTSFGKCRQLQKVGSSPTWLFSVLKAL